MSIRDQIRILVKDERLAFLPPLLASDPIERCIFLAEPVKEIILGPWADEDTEIRGKRLRAFLDQFTTGGTIEACLVPHLAKNAYLGRLKYPRDEVWDIRSRDPKPGIRVFGRFAEQDTFIALRWAKRAPCGDKYSREWRNQIKQCKADWRNLFPAYCALSGENLHDYISRNVIHN